MAVASRLNVTAALVAVQVFFGLHYAAARHIMTAIPPRAWATLRIVPAAILLMAYVLWRRPSALPRAPRDLWRLAVYSVFGVVINQVCFVEGLYRTRTAHSAIINTGIPVATLLIALVAGTESATGRKLTGIGLALCGVLYLLLHTGATMPGQFVTGDILTLINGLSYAFFLVISKPILSRCSSLGVTAWLLTFGAVGISALGLPQLLQLDVSAVPASVWWTGAFVVIFPTILAYILNSWALARVESSLVALFIYLQPLIAATLGVFWLGEPLGAETIIAGAFIFTGVGVAVWNRPGAARAASPDNS